jgi:RimJ/RimL family protein N-acetyltransferase
VVIDKGIGFCGEVYYVVEPLHQRASLDIKLRPETQGQGIATDALMTLIQHVLLVEWNVVSVWTQPSQVNVAARALYTRCGLTPKPRPADIETGESFWELTREETNQN